MTTYDVEFGHGSGWVAIVPSGTYAYIHNDMSRVAYYKFGIGSDTSGVALKKGECVKIEEVIYFKDNPHFDIKLTVVGD